MNIAPLYFLRHGETEWNAERRIQGQRDSPLTARGRAQARAQAALIRPVLRQAPACFVSPLGRAQQTAQIALGDYPRQTDARLAEIHAGDWQGRLHDEVALPDLSGLELFSNAPGGEGYAALEARIRDFLNGLTGPSVIVAHGLWGQVMRGLIKGLEREAMPSQCNRQAVVYLLENACERVLELAAEPDQDGSR